MTRPPIATAVPAPVDVRSGAGNDDWGTLVAAIQGALLAARAGATGAGQPGTLAAVRARLERALALAGGRPAPGPPALGPRHPGGLTARQVEVLRLVAAGSSNRAMAAALCRSERTVERHLENLYRKIDAHNKAEATAYALRHGLA